MNTATFLLVSSLILIAQGAVINNSPAEELRRTNVCLRTSNVSVESIQRIYTGRFVNEPNLKEYLWCVSRNAGFQDSNGWFQKDIIRLRLKGGRYSDDTIEDIMQECLRYKDTPQETAFEFTKCIYGGTFQKYS